MRMNLFLCVGIQYINFFFWGYVMKNLRSHIRASENQEQQSAADLTKKIASAYEGKSSVGIWMQILAEAEKSKRNGTLTNEEIEEFYQQFAPMLDDTQKKQLASVIEKLKGI